MTPDEVLKKLTVSVDRLHELLRDPHPGLLNWSLAFMQEVQQIGDYWNGKWTEVRGVSALRRTGVAFGAEQQKQRVRGELHEVVPAKTWGEAVERCGWKIGDRAEVRDIMAIANADGTYSMYPLFERVESDEG